MNSERAPQPAAERPTVSDPLEDQLSARIDGTQRVISRGTASPVVVTDERWRIVSLNPEAERLLGCSSNDATGSSCQALFYGRDRFGSRLPVEQSDVGLLVRRGEPVHPFDFDVISATGETIRAACSVIVLRDGPVCRIVHILTPIPQRKADAPAAGKNNGLGSHGLGRDRVVAPPYGLTAREYEVLRLLAEGSDCHQIAGTLFISLPTVRNHVHSFLRKLNVHSQVEAVALAYRERLI